MGKSPVGGSRDAPADAVIRFQSSHKVVRCANGIILGHRFSMILIKAPLHIFKITPPGGVPSGQCTVSAFSSRLSEPAEDSKPTTGIEVSTRVNRNRDFPLANGDELVMIGYARWKVGGLFLKALLPIEDHRDRLERSGFGLPLRVDQKTLAVRRNVIAEYELDRAAARVRSGRTGTASEGGS